MKVVVIGHPIKINRIMEVIRKIDDEVEFFYFGYDGIVPTTELIYQINECQKKVDIILFTGDVTFNIFSKEIVFTVPVGYVPKDIGSLLTALMEAMYRRYDIERISLDSYEKDLVYKLYSQIGIPANRIQVQNYHEVNIDEELIDKEFEYHYDLYSKGMVSVCLTCISDLYELLRRKNIPAIMVNSTDQIIETTFINLKQQYMLKRKEENDITVLFVEIDCNEEESLINGNDYQTVLEKLKVAQKVYLFSHSILGAIEEISTNKYIIITTRSNLIRETENFANISLFDYVRKNTMSTLSMGVGFGDTAREAKHNASLALIKARKSGGNCTYIIYDNEHLIGPVYSSGKQKDTKIDDKFLKIAKRSGVSINSIFKLSYIINKYEKNSFTVNELASLYGVSVRTMYRIIEKLEDANYAIEVGEKVVGNSGRPSRIIKLRFDI
ncbi:MAG TPA: HTH domain-containing protein [Clostridia bacterium]|nr:HTH domain-containing protein [Clostridia bacterium]